jgi:RNA polymerase sigma factor (sigma-70 family)
VVAADLVARVTPVLRRVIRVHLTRLRLVRVIDPLDICQATLASFFARLTVTWPQVRSPNHLTALLVAIARNRILDEVRRHTADCRDHRRVRTTDPADRLFQLAALDPSPSNQVAWTELYEQALRRLTAEERQLLEERLAGRSWAAIAADRRLSDEVLRQKLNRAVKRVRRQLLTEARAAAD